MASKKNYSKISTEGANAKQNEEVKVESTIAKAEADIVETVETKPETKQGIVVGCAKLNIRKEPKADAKIVGTLDQRTTVTIYGEEGNFYKIENPEGGKYCMKKYIVIKK